MINCALMGVDWTQLTFGVYASLLAEWNLRHPDPNAPREIDVDRLSRALAAHGAF